MQEPGNIKFKVFLNPEELESFDEYRDGEPNSIEEDWESEFHQKRLTGTLDIIEKAASPGMRIIDIGCGYGQISAEVKKRFPDARVTAIDASITALEKACRIHPGIDQFVLCDATRLPFPENSFDIALCNNIYEHILSPVLMLKSIRKVLMNDGLLIITTPSRYSTTNILRALAGKKMSIVRNHITEYTVGQMKEQLNFCGFSISGITSVSVKPKQMSSKRFFIQYLIKPLIKLFLTITGSHHTVEPVVFYLARPK